MHWPNKTGSRPKTFCWKISNKQKVTKSLTANYISSLKFWKHTFASLKTQTWAQVLPLQPCLSACTWNALNSLCSTNLTEVKLFQGVFRRRKNSELSRCSLPACICIAENENENETQVWWIIISPSVMSLLLVWLQRLALLHGPFSRWSCNDSLPGANSFVGFSIPKLHVWAQTGRVRWHCNVMHV